MKTILLICISSILNIATAGEVIWDYDQVESLSTSYSKNPLYLKRSILRDVKLEKTDLGKAMSPYYKTGNLVHKDYKSLLGQCYRITQYQNTTYAKKTKCMHKNFYVVVNQKRYDLVNNLEAYIGNEIEFDYQSAQTSFEAFHHTKYDFDRDDSPKRPYSLITVEAHSNKKLNIRNNRVYIDTIVKQSRSKYTFLSKKEEMTTAQLTIEPIKGDMVFSDGDQKLILLKRFQPGIFRFRVTHFNNAYVSFLKNIEKHLYDYKGSKRCFRDNYFAKSIYDCDTLVFQKTPVLKATHLNYIYVDLKSSEVLIK
jgi:hypothetical protein